MRSILVTNRVVLRTISVDNYRQRDIGRKAMFPIDLEAEKSDVELARLRLVEDAQDGDRLSESHAQRVASCYALHRCAPPRRRHRRALARSRPRHAALE